MRNSFSDDNPFDESDDLELDGLNSQGTNLQKQRARKRLEDYFEQKRLRECLGEDEFGDID
ncbi:hypothetical protein CWB72_16320 [Pseudoalteromonas phenolica]|uniref:PA3496 family putative envelope integrity protein n=1 Tax=Pseudoalteromonas phenolica TaxID=161398 RepID=UPI00110B4622|nr:hypothetical protein [Pseudoalteromonas phenolica]TMN87182.1 hypothetical protein CWB72_16320 [Pseudoalteromonas phenolica]